MKYVKITVDGVTYNLYKGADDVWRVTNRAPLSAGEYLMEVTIVTSSGQELIFDTTDEELIKALTLLVTEDATISGERMLNYYPEVIKVLLEYQALMFTEGFEVDFLNTSLEFVVEDAYLYTMGEERIAQWEKALNIRVNPQDSLEDRREVIISRIRGKGKLNTETINNIVATFTNYKANSYIKDSVLYVEIEAPADNKQFKFANVENELRNKIPAHLGLVVTRNYATWKEVKENFSNWNAVNQLDSWQDLLTWIAPQ